MSDVSDEELAQIAQMEADERKAQQERENRDLQVQLARFAQLEKEAQDKARKDQEDREFQIQLAKIAQLEKEAEDREMQSYLEQIAKFEQQEKKVAQQKRDMEAKQKQDDIFRLAAQFQAVADADMKRRQTMNILDTDVSEMADALSLLYVTPPAAAKSNVLQKPSQVAESKSKLVSFCGPLPWVSIMNRNAWAPNMQEHPELKNVCMRECGGGGDCMFYALGTAYAMLDNRLLTPQETYEQMLQVRQWLADSLTVKNITQFLHQQQQEKFTSDENRKRKRPGLWPTDPETWRPDSYGSTKDLFYVIPGTAKWIYHDDGTKTYYPGDRITHRYPFPKHLEHKLNINHPNFEYYGGFVKPPAMTDEQARLYSRNSILLANVQKDLKTPGYKYQGDTESLRYLVHSKTFKEKSLGIFIIDDDGRIECTVYPENEPRDLYIGLYHLPGHWRLAGFAIAPNTVQVIIPRNDLPKVLKYLFKRFCETRENVTGLPEVLL